MVLSCCKMAVVVVGICSNTSSVVASTKIKMFKFRYKSTASNTMDREAAQHSMMYTGGQGNK